MRTATETVNEFRYLSENPDEIFDVAQAAFAKAAALYRASVPKISSMFNEARLGKAVMLGEFGLHDKAIELGLWPALESSPSFCAAASGMSLHA